jgi:hypothetical protein
MTSPIPDILTDALILVGAYAQGQTANTDDLSLAFRVINRKLDSLSAEKLSMVGMVQSSYPLTGAGSYAYGPGLQWSTFTRPIKIKSISVIASNGVERPCRIATADQWAAVPDKSRTGVYAEDAFYDNGYPTGVISLSPRPAVGGSAILWTFMPLVALPNQTGTVDLAPGYTEAIVTIAAVELCIAFQRPLTQELNNAAEQSKNVIVQLNAELFNAPAPPPEGPGPTAPPALRTT